MIPNTLLKYTRLRLIVLITLIAIVLSVLITYVITLILADGFVLLTLSSAIIVPLLVAPALTWYVVGLMFRVQKLEQEQRYLASYDMLTDLYTRRSFLELYEEAFEACAHDQTSLSFAYIDIDNFKSINSEYGHAGGDEVLKHFGHILRTSLRSVDVSGRIGGEEFAIVLPHSEEDSINAVLTRLLENTDTLPVKFGTTSIHFTISIGYSSYTFGNACTSKQLINRADQALLVAKNQGKNQIVRFEDTQTARSV